MQQTKRKPRQTQKQRSLATTGAIMEASIDLIFENGFAGMTIAQVSQQSGASQGAITHHYGNKENLVLAAARYTVEREKHRLHSDLPSPSNRKEALNAYFEASEQFFLNKYFVALLEIFLAARRNSRISSVFDPLIASHRQLFDNTWLKILTRAGLEESEANKLISMTNFMLRGISLTLTRLPDETLTDDIKAQCVLFRQQFHLLFD